MLDALGAITLTVLGLASVAALILGSPLGPPAATRLAVVAGAWFVAVVVLTALGLFTRVGPPAIVVAVLGPIAVGVGAALRGSAVRTLALGVPVALLVLVNAGRLLGAFFVALHADGRLPATFARTAGWGDIAVGLLALPVALIAWREAPGWRPLTLAWNAFSLVDLIVAVTLGFGSTPDSPLRFIYEDTAPGTLAMLPWALIPAFLVPIYMLTHLAVFSQLAARSSAVASRLAVHVGHR